MRVLARSRVFFFSSNYLREQRGDAHYHFWYKPKRIEEKIISILHWLNQLYIESNNVGFVLKRGTGLRNFLCKK